MDDLLAEPQEVATPDQTDTEKDLHFLASRFLQGVGRCIRDTMTHLTSVEQFEQRRRQWSSVHQLMLEACAEGLQRQPPVGVDLISYYLSAVP